MAVDEKRQIILHLVAYDVSRGAERYARSLVDALNLRDGARHLLVTMFKGEETGLEPDLELAVTRGYMRRLGLDPRVVTRLRGVIGRVQPDGIVAHGGEPAKYAAVGGRRGVPYVYLVIGSSHPRLSAPWRRAMRHLYLSRASRVVAVSQQLAADLRANGDIESDRIEVIPNGRNPTDFRRSDLSARRSPHVVFVGRLEEQKRPGWFIDLVLEMRQRGVALTAAMAGGGPLADPLRDHARSAGVEMLGPIDDVPELLANSDVLVLTSRPPEGMPGVLIEAGLAGLPVVTTDVPGADEVIVDGSTGVIVAVDDKSRMANELHHLLENQMLRVEMGRKAHERCSTAFSLEDSAASWERLLNDVVSPPDEVAVERGS